MNNPESTWIGPPTGRMVRKRKAARKEVIRFFHNFGRFAGGRLFKEQGDTGDGQDNLIGHGRQGLIQVPGKVPEFSGQGIIRDDPPTHFIGYDHRGNRKSLKKFHCLKGLLPERTLILTPLGHQIA